MKQKINLLVVIIGSFFAALIVCSVIVKLLIRSEEIPWFTLSVMGFPLLIIVFSIMYLINEKISKSDFFIKIFNNSIIENQKLNFLINKNYCNTKNLINKNKTLNGACLGGTLGAVIIVRNLYGLIVNDESTGIFYLPIFYIPTFILSLPWSLIVLITDSNVTNQIAISFGALINGIIIGGFLGYMNND